MSIATAEEARANSPTVLDCFGCYPPDLYWKGKPPIEEYNYVLVDVEPAQKTKFTLTRYRPGPAEPFATEALFT